MNTFTRPEQDEFISSFESRITNSFKRHGIYTTGQLLTLSEIDLVNFGNIGWTSVDKITKALKAQGLELRSDPLQYSASSRKRKQKPTKTKIVKNALKQLLS